MAATMTIIQTPVSILAPLLFQHWLPVLPKCLQPYRNQCRFSSWATLNLMDTAITQFYIIWHRLVKICSTIRNSNSFDKPATLAPIGANSSLAHVFYRISPHYHIFSAPALQTLASSGSSHYDMRFSLISWTAKGGEILYQAFNWTIPLPGHLVVVMSSSGFVMPWFLQ